MNRILSRKRLWPRQVHLFRLVIILGIVLTGVGAFATQSGIFRFMFRGMLIVGALALVGSHLWQLWSKKKARSKARAEARLNARA